MDDLNAARAADSSISEAPAVPPWVAGAGPWDAFREGLKVAREIPAFILAATGAGFGALAHDAGIGFGHAAFMSVILYATPAQVVLVDQLARGASLIGGAFAITLTAVRLLPMMVSLMPYLRTPGAPRWHYVAASHFIAITSWTEAFRRLPVLPAELRIAHFLGLGTGLMLCLTAGTVVGYSVAGNVPPLLTSALLFMTPLYFLMSQVGNARLAIDWAAIAAGLILGPVFFLAAPGFDLLLTGLVGGTLAFLACGPGSSKRGKS